MPFSPNETSIRGPSCSLLRTSLCPLPIGGNMLASLCHVIPRSDERLTGIIPSMELPLPKAIREPSPSSAIPAWMPGIVVPVSFQVSPPSSLRSMAVPSWPPAPASQHWTSVPSERTIGPAITWCRLACSGPVINGRDQEAPLPSSQKRVTRARSCQSPEVETPFMWRMVPPGRVSRELPVIFLSGTEKKSEAGSHSEAPRRSLEPSTTISRPCSLSQENQIARRSPFRHHVTAGWWLCL